MGLLEYLGLKVKTPDIEPAAGTVTAEAAAAAYFKTSALATAITYKANALSMCAIRVIEGGEEVKNELWYKLNYSPNPNQNSSQFMNYFMEQLCRNGQALIVPIRRSFYVADSFGVVENQLSDNVFDNVVVEGKQYNRSFKASKCMFFKLNDRNVSAFVNETLEQYSQMMALAMKSYKDTCGQKYKVVLDRAPSGDVDEEKKYQDFLAGNLKTFIENANAVYMETRGQRLEPVKAEGGAEPADITSLRKEMYDAAAVAFKIPRPIMYGDMTNMGDLVNVMLTFAVDPEAQMFGEEATRKNYTQEEICNGGCKIKVDTTTIKHVDIFDVAPSVMNLISSGVRTIDDVNEALGFERENSETTSARLMTKNLGAIEDVLREAKQGGESK